MFIRKFPGSMSATAVTKPGLSADWNAWALQVALMNYLESAWRRPAGTAGAGAAGGVWVGERDRHR